MRDAYYEKWHRTWSPMRWWHWPLLITAVPLLLVIAIVYALCDVAVNGIYEE
jgi:hypothetical protein